MQKTKYYDNVHFSADVIRAADEAFGAVLKRHKLDPAHAGILSVDHDDQSRWTYDEASEFFADYRQYSNRAMFSRWTKNGTGISIRRESEYTYVEVTVPSRSDILAIFDVFESNVQSSLIPHKPNPDGPLIFIGHGRNNQWFALKNHLQDQHHFRIETFETGARAGHTIRDILDDMTSKSSLALLVLTAEDEHKDGTYHARENVIHETGLFQGKLGFSKAIVLLEEGAAEFSNIHGIQQIRFSKGNIRETFGDVLATIRREFPRSV